MSQPSPARDDMPGRKKPRRTLRSASRDLTPLLRGWDYEPGVISVRKITGIDGTTKLQMRLDLGLLQMELAGRPDGIRPHGHESLLEYHEQQLTEHLRRNGTELGFHLNSAQCTSLREEAGQYYYRYLSLFVLEEFPGVVRDTARNLRVLDLCARFAVHEQDRAVLEQYRPYILMMHSRAQASILFRERRFAEALQAIDTGLEKVKDFYERFNQGDAFSQSSEARVLRRFAREIRKSIPVDPVTKLQTQLDRAVKGELYEEAARLRDEIRKQQVTRDRSRS